MVPWLKIICEWVGIAAHVGKRLDVIDVGCGSGSLLRHLEAKPNFGHVRLSAKNLGDLLGAFERLIRYLLILSDALTMTMTEERGRYRVT